MTEDCIVVDLPLADGFKFGIQTIHRRTEPATGPWLPEQEDGKRLVEMVDALGYDSLWVGDHIAFAIPILDPLLQLAQAATWSKRLTFGTGVYLAPLRQPAGIAKQIATLDHLSGGRLIFGLGVGGEFPKEFEVSGVPHKERGARLSETMQILRKLWSGEPVSHFGPFLRFEDVQMLPAPRQPGGPPMWVGGRSEGALHRAGALADGWLSYVVTPEMYRTSMEAIATAYSGAGRELASYGSGHLLFCRTDDTYEAALDAATETLSVRYAMDFRRAAERYCALGPPADVAAKLAEFHEAGARHIILDLMGPYEQRDEQIERFAKEVLPLVGHLR